MTWLICAQQWQISLHIPFSAGWTESSLSPWRSFVSLSPHRHPANTLFRLCRCWLISLRWTCHFVDSICPGSDLVELVGTVRWDKVINVHPTFWRLVQKIKFRHQMYLVFIHQKNPCPNSWGYFISKGCLLLAEGQSEQRYPRFKKSQFCYNINYSKYILFMRIIFVSKCNQIPWFEFQKCQKFWCKQTCR